MPDSKDAEAPATSAAPVSTPIASPVEAKEESTKTASSDGSAAPAAPAVAPANDTQDVAMKDADANAANDNDNDDDLDKDLFGDSDDLPTATDATAGEVSTDKPPTPAVTEQQPAAAESAIQVPAATATATTTTTPSPTTVPTTETSKPSDAPVDTQKHSRPPTPQGEENPAKRLKTETGQEPVTANPVQAPVTATTESSEPPQAATQEVVASAPVAAPAVAPPVAPSPSSPSQGEGLAKHQAKFALASLRAVKRLRDAGPFLAPVDIVKLNIPNYFDHIKHPMDLSTMERKVTNNEYASVAAFIADMELIVSNCVWFNGSESAIAVMAYNIKSSFDKHMKNMPERDQVPVVAPKPKRKSFPVTSTSKPTRTPSQSLNANSSTPKTSHVATASAPHSVPPKQNKATTPTESKPFALQPSGMPTIRRDSSVDGRPKREIHPPKPKDLPYGDIKPRRKKFAAELKFCGAVIKELMSKKHEAYSFPFLQPVDPVALNCPDYFKIIKEPMDLSTISKRYNVNQYENADEFEHDVRLMFRNCYKFNPEGSPVNVMGHRLESVFDKKWLEKPLPAPTPPPAEHGESDFEDSDYDSEDQLELLNNPAIKMLEDQLGRMQKELDKLKKDTIREARERRRKSKVKKTSNKQPKTEGTRRKSAPAPRSSPVVTYEMKKELSEAIGNLSEKKMGHVLTLIQESVPHLRNTDQEEIELDMDMLDNETLLKLYNYAVRKDESKASRHSMAPKSTHNSSSGGAGSSKSSGSSKKKSKPLSEAEQTRQIEQLQKKIEQFDRAESGASPSAGGGGGIDISSSEDQDDGSSDDSSSEEE